jgi:hypothetical protein
MSFAVAAGGAAVMHGRAAVKSQQARLATLLAGILLLSGLGYYAYITHRAASTHYAINLFDRVTKKPRSVPVSSSALTINQLGYSYFQIDVPQKASSVVLHGSFTARGGDSNNIEAFVFSDNDYLNWQKRRASSPFYSSGKVSMGTIDANLPEGAGTYYLVFNNKFSVLAPKTIHVNAALTYYQ